MKNIKTFEGFFSDLFKKKDNSEVTPEWNVSTELVDNILSLQGEESDQREDKKIYTEEELSSMSDEELLHIWREMYDPYLNENYGRDRGTYQENERRSDRTKELDNFLRKKNVINDDKTSEIIERFKAEFGNRDFSTQEFAEFYHVLRTEGFDGIQIFNALGNMIPENNDEE